MTPGYIVDKQKKYKQCKRCGRIEVGDKWIFPLEAIIGGIDPELVMKFPECQQCKDDVTFSIIAEAFPAIVQ